MEDEREKNFQRIKKIALEEHAAPSTYEMSYTITNKPVISDDDEYLAFNKLYLDKLEMGRRAHGALERGIVVEEALPKNRKECLDLYRRSRHPIDLTDIKLRIWQETLLEKIKEPTEREVIWVRGVMGNEGKTWFQKYAQSLFGYSRVAILDLKNKTANILHALRKFSLSTVDMFLFNDARADNYHSCCYTVLEYIKDGSATAPKFNSERIQFRTPNIVVVFSNNDPDLTQLSKDRWVIYYANKNELKCHTNRLLRRRNHPKYAQKPSEEEEEAGVEKET